MQLPFTVEQFFSVFHKYNETIWLAQILLIFLVLLAIFLVLKPARWSGVVIEVCARLAATWFSGALISGRLARPQVQPTLKLCFLKAIVCFPKAIVGV